MITAKDVIYLIGLLFTAGTGLWWLSAKISVLGAKIDTVGAEIKEIKEAKLAERVAVLEARTTPASKLRRIK